DVSGRDEGGGCFGRALAEHEVSDLSLGCGEREQRRRTPWIPVRTKLERTRRIPLDLREGEELLGALGSGDQRGHRRIDELRRVAAGRLDQLQRRRVMVRSQLGEILAPITGKRVDPLSRM